MPSDRPYSGMSWDDLEDRIDKVMVEFVRELTAINEELQHRHTRSARALHERVKRLYDFFVRGGYD